MPKAFPASLNLVALSVLALLMSQTGAQAASAGSLFQVSELPHLASGHAVQVAAKCGAGSCGSKPGDKMMKDKDHSCAKDKEHSCGKDKEHSCAKDKEHSCAKEKTPAKAPATH